MIIPGQTMKMLEQTFLELEQKCLVISFLFVNFSRDLYAVQVSAYKKKI